MGRRSLSESVPCLNPACKRKFGGSGRGVGCRGLCRSCYAVALSLVKKKETSWEELENLGLAQPTFTSTFYLSLIEKRKLSNG
jgi:hypothetical protein